MIPLEECIEMSIFPTVQVKNREGRLMQLNSRHARDEDYMNSLDAPEWLPSGSTKSMPSIFYSGWQGEVSRESMKGGY